MIDLHNEALKALNEGKHQEAYDLFSKNYHDNNSIDSRYCRALVDYSFLHAHYEETKEDLFYVANSKSKLKHDATFLLINFFEMEREYQKVILFGEKLLNAKDVKSLAVNNGIYFVKSALVDGYYQFGGDEYNQKAYDLLNDLATNHHDEGLDIYPRLVKVTLRLKKYDETLKVIELIQKEYGSCKDLYISKYLYQMELAKDHPDDESYLTNALDYLEIATKYVEDKGQLINEYVAIYILKKAYDEAFKLIEEVTNDQNYFQMLNAKYDLYCQLDDHDKQIEVYEEAYHKYDDPRVAYAYVYILYDAANTLELVRKTAQVCKEVITKYEPFEQCVNILNACYTILGEHEEAYKMINEISNNNPEHELILNQLENVEALNKDYIEACKLVNKAFHTGYISKLLFLDLYLSICDNPKKYYKDVKILQYLKPDDFPLQSIKKMSSRFLYGSDGIKRNLKKARTFYEACLEKLNSKTCIFASIGRIDELEHLEDAAFANYQNAYELASKQSFLDCTCQHAFLADAYIRGIGTPIDEEKAKAIILEALKNNRFVYNDGIIYLYTYFALLLNNEEFSLTKALDLLNYKYAFNRYDSFRYLQIIQVKKKLQLPFDEDLKLLKKCYKFQSRQISSFVKKNLNSEYTYPKEFLF